MLTELPVALSLPTVLALVAGYVLGSIPFGLLLTRAAGIGDIRSIGSGNIGATNVLRTGNKGLAAATLLLDGLKGTAAVYVGAAIGTYFLMNEFQAVAAAKGTSLAVMAPDMNKTIAALAAGLGAFLGHVYPAWLGFKGGKGVATYIGVLLGLLPQAAAVFCAVWLLTALVTRYSSLSALLAAISAPVAIWALGEPRIALVLAPLSALLIFKHRSNIERLLAGQEPRIGASKIGVEA